MINNKKSFLSNYILRNKYVLCIFKNLNLKKNVKNYYIKNK